MIEADRMENRLAQSGEILLYNNGEEKKLVSVVFKKAVRFRQRAARTLKKSIQKGFVLDDGLVKDGRFSGRDCFDERLDRIREIRAGGRRAYQKVADIWRTGLIF